MAVIRRVTALVLMLLLVAGCTSAAPVTTPIGPSAPKACGGFHVVIENATGFALRISINGEPVVDVDQGATPNVAQFGNYRVPAMPWRVEVSRIPDQVPIYANTFQADGTDGVRVRLEVSPAVPASPSPFSC